MYTPNWSLVYQYLPLYLNGVVLGLEMAAASLFAGSVIGLVAATLSLRKSRLLKVGVRVYVEVIRNVPILLWAYFAFYGLPFVGVTFLDNVSSFVVALSVYSGAYLTEVFRSGLSSIPSRYAETGRAMGLTSQQRMSLITLPLMFRIVLPPLSSTLIGLFKDTSVAAALSVPEVTYAALTVNTLTFRVLEAWSIASVLYVGVGNLLALLFRALETRYRMVQ